MQVREGSKVPLSCLVSMLRLVTRRQPSRWIWIIQVITTLFEGILPARGRGEGGRARNLINKLNNIYRSN